MYWIEKRWRWELVSKTGRDILFYYEWTNIKKSPFPFDGMRQLYFLYYVVSKIFVDQ